MGVIWVESFQSLKRLEIASLSVANQREEREREREGKEINPF